VTLSWLAGFTRRLELGTTVAVLPYRHPLQVASMSESLHRLSGGRFILGVGVGWARQEYAALGVPFEKRGAVTDDYLEAIRALWSRDVASHDGPFASFEEDRTDAGSGRSRPPVWVVGLSEAALRRAVRLGDRWHPNNAWLGWLEREGMPRLEEIASEEGRPMPSLCPRVRLRITDAPLDDGRLPGEGSLEQVRSDLEVLESLGAEHVVLDTFYGDPGATRPPERAWAMLATLAESVVDLERRRLR
jgi:probable F420-dependent oxidoreductase